MATTVAAGRRAVAASAASAAFGGRHALAGGVGLAARGHPLSADEVETIGRTAIAVLAANLAGGQAAQLRRADMVVAAVRTALAVLLAWLAVVAAGTARLVAFAALVDALTVAGFFPGWTRPALGGIGVDRGMRGGVATQRAGDGGAEEHGYGRPARSGAREGDDKFVESGRVHRILPQDRDRRSPPAARAPSQQTIALSSIRVLALTDASGGAEGVAGLSDVKRHGRVGDKKGWTRPHVAADFSAR
jgi:hypothetical protein